MTAKQPSAARKSDRRSYTKTCANPDCTETFRPWKSTQRYCSNRCANSTHAPSLQTKQLGGRARVASQRKASGIPADAPKNKYGVSCKEKVCTVCGEVFLAQWSQSLTRKTCSPRCAGLAKRAIGRDRQGTRNPNYKHGKRAGERDREGERRWYAALQMMCAHPDCPGPRGVLVLHHLVYRQEVRRRHGDEYDPRNAMTLCGGCHASHHHRGRYVVPLAALRPENFEFARELLGDFADDYLARRYVTSGLALEGVVAHG